ncbi:MAG: TonB-dependent receptor [Flavobacteriales bacterium]
MSYLFKAYIFLIFLFSTACYTGQKITFVNEFGNAIKSKKVIFQNQFIKDTFTTNRKGVILLKSLNIYDTISINFAGKTYIQSQLELSKKNFLFQISNNKNQSLPVFVTSTSSSTQLPTGMKELNHQVVKSSEILNSNASTGAELLTLVDGVTIQKTSFGGGSPIIRGFEANRILLMVDGVRMNNAIYRGGHLQNSITIDPFILESCDVIFGPSAVSYGSDAIGGVIHYKTKDPNLLNTNDSSRYNGLYFTRFNSATNELSNHINFNLSGKNIASLTSITYKKFGDVSMGENRVHGFQNWGTHDFYTEYNNFQDTMITNPNPSIQRGVGYNQIDLTNKILFKLNATSKLIINSQYSSSSNLQRLDQLNNLTLNNLPEYAQWNYGPQKRLLNSISFSSSHPSIFFDDIRAVLSHQHIEESRITRRFNSFSQKNSLEKVNVLGSNIQFSKSIGSNSKLDYGTEIYYNTVNSRAYELNLLDSATSYIDSRYPSGGSNTFFPAIYGSYNLKKNRLSLIGGIRYTWNKAFGIFNDNILDFLSDGFEIKRHSLSGSLGTYFYPNETTKIFLDLSTGFRAPNIDDLGKVFIKDQFLTVPNSQLDPEYAYNFSFGIGKKIDFKNIQFSFSSSSFVTILDNVITKQSLEINGSNLVYYDSNYYEILANQNSESGIVYGLSGSLFITFFKNLKVHSSLCYTRGVLKNTHIPMSHIPPLFGKLNLNYTFKKIEFQILNNFNAEKINKLFGQGNTDNPLEASPMGYPSWWVINTQVGYQYRESLNLSLGLYNLLDIHYKTFASGISAPGRSLMASAKLSF